MVSGRDSVPINTRLQSPVSTSVSAIPSGETNDAASNGVGEKYQPNAAAAEPSGHAHNPSASLTITPKSFTYTDPEIAIGQRRQLGTHDR